MGAPCVNVAGLSDDKNMPLGIQIVGRFGRDRAALEAALFVEQAIAKKTGGSHFSTSPPHRGRGITRNYSAAVCASAAGS